MANLFLTVIAGGLLVGGLLWAYRNTTQDHAQTPTRAVLFFAYASLLSGIVLVTGIVLPYEPWFTTGLAVLTAVLLVQMSQAIVFRSMLDSPYADPTLVNAFFGTKIREQTGDSIDTDTDHAGRRTNQRPDDESSMQP